MKNNVLARIKSTVVLDVAGLGLLSTAAGLLDIIAGVAAAGISCLLISWRVGNDA